MGYVIICSMAWRIEMEGNPIKNEKYRCLEYKKLLGTSYRQKRFDVVGRL